MAAMLLLTVMLQTDYMPWSVAPGDSWPYDADQTVIRASDRWRLRDETATEWTGSDRHANRCI